MKANANPPAQAGKQSSTPRKTKGEETLGADAGGSTEAKGNVTADETVLIGCDTFSPLQEIPEGFSLPAAALAFEARYISFALQTNAGSVTKAAQRLGISHQNMSLQLTQRHQALRSLKKPRAVRRDSTKG